MDHKQKRMLDQFDKIIINRLKGPGALKRLVKRYKSMTKDERIKLWETGKK